MSGGCQCPSPYAACLFTILVFYCCSNRRPQLQSLLSHIFGVGSPAQGLKSRCQQNCIPSGGSRGESISLSFKAFRCHLPSLTHDPFCTSLRPLLRHHIAFSLALTVLCDYIGSIQILQDNFPVPQSRT